MWKSTPIIFLVLAFGASVSYGVETAAAVKGYSAYPYMVLVKDVVGSRFFVGLTVSRLYIVTSAELTTATVPATVTLKYLIGGTSVGSTIVTNGQVTVLKACSMVYPAVFANVYKLTPSLFFDSTTTNKTTAASYLYFRIADDLVLEGTTEVFHDAECPTEIIAELAPTGVTYDPAIHYCLVTDCTSDCTWIQPTQVPPKTTRSVLIVNNQVVGFFRGGICDSTANSWRSAIIYSKILPARDFIMSSSFDMALVP